MARRSPAGRRVSRTRLGSLRFGSVRFCSVRFLRGGISFPFTLAFVKARGISPPVFDKDKPSHAASRVVARRRQNVVLLAARRATMGRHANALTRQSERERERRTRTAMAIEENGERREERGTKRLSDRRIGTVARTPSPGRVSTTRRDAPGLCSVLHRAAAVLVIPATRDTLFELYSILQLITKAIDDVCLKYYVTIKGSIVPVSRNWPDSPYR